MPAQAAPRRRCRQAASPAAKPALSARVGSARASLPRLRRRPARTTKPNARRLEVAVQVVVQHVVLLAIAHVGARPVARRRLDEAAVGARLRSAPPVSARRRRPASRASACPLRTPLVVTAAPSAAALLVLLLGDRGALRAMARSRDAATPHAAWSRRRRPRPACVVKRVLCSSSFTNGPLFFAPPRLPR